MPRLDAQTLFRRHFKFTPTHIVRAPGSVELLGSQKLCSDGLVISAALDKGVEIASTPRTDGLIEILTPDRPDKPEGIRVGEFKSNPDDGWLGTVKSVLARLVLRGVHISGFSAVVADDLPPGTNFGRVPACEVALLLTVRQLFPFGPTESGLGLPPSRDQNGKLPPLAIREKTLLAKWFEPHPNGRIAGSADRLGCMTSLLGKAWHALYIDLKFGTVEATSLAGAVLVVCAPRPAATSSDTAIIRAMAARSEETPPGDLCDSAAGHLGAKSLRSVEMDILKAQKSKLTPREFDCASHVVGEFSRVVAAERALRNEEQKQFGEFMLQSHESRRDLVKDVLPDAELLVKAARLHPACLGARGCPEAGGGATINLVRHHQADAFAKHMAQYYEARMGRQLATHVLQMVDGAS